NRFDFPTDCLGFKLVHILAVSRSFPNVYIHQRRIDTLGSLRNAQRLNEVFVKSPIAVGDDWSRASEVLSQHHLLCRKDRRCNVIERLIWRENRLIRLFCEKTGTKFLNLGGRDKAACGGHLPVIPYYQQGLAS